MNKLPVVALISGRGSNLKALIEASRGAAAHAAPVAYEVVGVIADRPAAGLEVARTLGVAARCVPAADHLDGAGFESALAAAIDGYAPALVVLAGFMRILSAGFVARYAGRLLNIHPSLLPRHPGLHTHARALAAGDTVHGATVHFVTAELDAGPRVVQARVAVRPAEDERTLAAHVLAHEHRIYPLAVDWYCSGRLRCHDGRAWLDGRPLDEPVRVD